MPKPKLGPMQIAKLKKGPKPAPKPSIGKPKPGMKKPKKPGM